MSCKSMSKTHHDHLFRFYFRRLHNSDQKIWYPHRGIHFSILSQRKKHQTKNHRIVYHYDRSIYDHLFVNHDISRKAQKKY